MECPGDDLVLRFAQGQLPATEEHALQSHLAECDDCRHLVAEAAQGLADSNASEHPTAPSAPDDPRAVPTTPSHFVGRYKLLDVIGAGGMGVVYTAFDPQLNRKVALKLVRASSSNPQVAARSRARLLREAQAMAQLSHVNVVTVHDAGTHEGQVFVAMELVQGETLRLWLKGHKKGWRGAVEIFVAAGRGLAAAHASGLVHRDFKPDNVLVGLDGRVRVTDFGLARLELGEPEESPSAEERRAARPLSMTETGMLLGTPAYMAPEQLKGQHVDARSDQFSFCVALFEALSGGRPYKLTSVDSEASPFPKGSPVHPSIVAVLQRGLSVDPAARFSSMAGLLDTLEGGLRAPTRSRAAWAAAASVVLAAGGVALTFALRAPAAPAAVTPPSPVLEQAAKVDSPPATLAPAPTPAATAVAPEPVEVDAPPPAHPARRTVNHRPTKTTKTFVPAQKLRPNDDDAPIDNPWVKSP